jgi:hypothetical protein
VVLAAHGVLASQGIISQLSRYAILLEVAGLILLSLENKKKD